MATVRARYEKGVLTPLEPLELEDGAEVVVAVAETGREKIKILGDIVAPMPSEWFEDPNTSDESLL